MTDRPTDAAPASRSINPLLVIGAAIGALVIIGIVVFALSRRDDPGTGTASPTPSASASSTERASPSESASTGATPSATPEPSEAARPITGITWEEPAPFDGAPSELMVDGDTWIAVGWASERGPGAWTSSDAETWERADVVDPMPDDLFLGSGLGPTVRLGDSLLSYGTFIGCCDGRGVLGWRSADGTSWDVIESDSPLFETGYVVLELAVGDPALVAVEGRYSAFSGRIWRWTEATSWVETTPNTSGTEEPSGMITSDIAWADGRYVVVGASGDPLAPDGGSIAGKSWASTDGETWEESEPTAELEDVELVQVAPIPGGGFVALGSNDAANFGRGGGTVAFTSPDGLAWSPAEMPSMGPATRPVEIVAVEGGLIAVGSEAGSTTIVWTSADGAAWTDAGRLDFPPEGAAADDEQIVIIAVDQVNDFQWVLHRGSIGR